MVAGCNGGFRQFAFCNQHVTLGHQAIFACLEEEVEDGDWQAEEDKCDLRRNFFMFLNTIASHRLDSVLTSPENEDLIPQIFDGLTTVCFHLCSAFHLPFNVVLPLHSFLFVFISTHW